MRWLAQLMLFLCLLAKSASAATISITAQDADVPNLVPFSPLFGPHAGGVYRNLPAFNLVPGDTIAFDSIRGSGPGVSTFRLTMAKTLGNGTAVRAGPFILVDTITAAGDRIVNNFDIVFTVQHAFSFLGGGLILNIETRSGERSLIQIGGAESDPSGYFLGRYFSRSTPGPAGVLDGNSGVPQFIMTTSTPPPPIIPLPAATPLLLTALGVLMLCARRKNAKRR